MGSSIFIPVDDKLQCDMDYDHPIMVMRRSEEEEARKKARDEEIALQDLDNRGSLFDANNN